MAPSKDKYGVSFRDQFTRGVSGTLNEIGTRFSPRGGRDANGYGSRSFNSKDNTSVRGERDTAILQFIRSVVSELYSFIQDVRTLALVFGFAPIIVLVWTLPFVGMYFSHVEMPNILISDLLESNKTIYKSLFTFGMCSAGATSLYVFAEYSKHLNQKFERHLRHINSKLHEIIQEKSRANNKGAGGTRMVDDEGGAGGDVVDFDDMSSSQAKRMRLINNDTMRLKK